MNNTQERGCHLPHSRDPKSDAVPLIQMISLGSHMVIGTVHHGEQSSLHALHCIMVFFPFCGHKAQGNYSNRVRTFVFVSASAAFMHQFSFPPGMLPPSLPSTSALHKGSPGLVLIAKVLQAFTIVALFNHLPPPNFIPAEHPPPQSLLGKRASVEQHCLLTQLRESRQQN